MSGQDKEEEEKKRNGIQWVEQILSKVAVFNCNKIRVIKQNTFDAADRMMCLHLQTLPPFLDSPGKSSIP